MKRLTAILLCLGLLFGTAITEGTVLLGDADGDQDVDSADAAFVLRTVVGLAAAPSDERLVCCDANRNGAVEASDSACILRFVVGLTDSVDSYLPPATPTPSPVPSEAPTPTAPPSATPDPVLNSELYFDVAVGLGSSVGDSTVYAVTKYLLELPEEDPYTKVLLAAVPYLGTAYDEMDCSKFVRQCFRDCDYGSSVITGNSDGMLKFFRNKGILEDALDSDGNILYDRFRPGSVLIYVDDDDVANHVALYLGEINGAHYLMDSSTGRDMVCIRTVWTWGSWNLTYFANPLGD